MLETAALIMAGRYPLALTLALLIWLPSSDALALGLAVDPENPSL